MGRGTYRIVLGQCARPGLRSNCQGPSNERDQFITGERSAFTHVRAQRSHLEGKSGVTVVRQDQYRRGDADAPQLSKDVECTGGPPVNVQNDEIED
jgi:hypothetical protein